MAAAETTDDADGISWADFKSIAFDTGEWIWGTAQGAFNEKATTGQIVTDAVISLIPLVGDATAVRDLIAVTMGLIEDPKKREEKMQWVMLVLLVFALIPVIGGAIKGVGRLVVKAAEEAARLANATARTARLMEAAKDIVAVLNRVGAGHAERWLLKLRFAEHEAQVVKELDKFFTTVSGALQAVERRLGILLPDSVLHTLKRMREGIAKLKELASSKIPTAIKELDTKLREIQQYIREGGEITSKATSHTAAVGAKNMSYLDEARLIEGEGQSQIAFTGHHRPNEAKVSESVYKVEEGYPDLLTPRPGGDPNIVTYTGKVINHAFEPGEQIFRVFGPEQSKALRGVKASETSPVGAFWGVGPPPATGKEWRHQAAVLDEWNGNGFIMVGTVLEPARVKGSVGKIAGQTAKNGQILTGGGTQAMIFFSNDVRNALLPIAAQVTKNGIAKTVEVGGVLWEIRPTNWAGVNGAVGYVDQHIPERLGVSAIRLGDDERVKKAEE